MTKVAGVLGLDKTVYNEDSENFMEWQLLINGLNRDPMFNTLEIL